jgi:hypothetical protein
MSNTNDGIHTTTNPKGTGWANQAGGIILSTHQLKVNAVDEGKALAKRHGTQHIVHRRDGTVLDRHSYAASPIG